MSDPKVLFICFDFPEVPIHIECFDDPDTLDEKFDLFLSEYFNTKVEIDTVNQDISLPHVFNSYKSDFGSTNESILKYIWKWYNNSQFELSEIIKLINKNNLIIKFVDVDPQIPS